MSISNPKIEKPCRKFIEFKGDKGQFYYYDNDRDEQIEIPVPIYFVRLDELSTITGYNKNNKCGIYSNEVRKTTTDVLQVKTFKGGESITGLYNDIKDAVKSIGGKFTKSVYCMLIEDGKPSEMVNFKFHGAAFAAWVAKKFNPDKNAIGITGFTEGINGNVTYKLPVFTPYKLSPELRAAAITMDKELQKYLSEKEIVKAEAEKAAPEPEPEPEPEPVDGIDIDPLPF